MQTRFWNGMLGFANDELSLDMIIIGVIIRLFVMFYWEQLHTRFLIGSHC